MTDTQFPILEGEVQTRSIWFQEEKHVSVLPQK